VKNWSFKQEIENLKITTENRNLKVGICQQKREKFTVKIIISVKNKLPLTLATRDLGIWLNLKMVLYLGSLGKSERLRIFNPKPLVARGR
jgi:hypothetical protein